ncbi:hypothetical protein CALCODRAFT_506176 [Calocera cornea HHB12733]|uniref:Uncharacterized protein n=1 Tax=Calocera cornea HHB12733 TaxID=1353952 RepID=A0A165JBG7_9BASI|nr:hypothetical protein CALCODRAFT_506176 [Calocera cornea HHB12733]
MSEGDNDAYKRFIRYCRLGIGEATGAGHRLPPTETQTLRTSASANTSEGRTAVFEWVELFKKNPYERYVWLNAQLEQLDPNHAAVQIATICLLEPMKASAEKASGESKTVNEVRAGIPYRLVPITKKKPRAPAQHENLYIPTQPNRHAALQAAGPSVVMKSEYAMPVLQIEIMGHAYTITDFFSALLAFIATVLKAGTEEENVARVSLAAFWSGDYCDLPSTWGKSSMPARFALAMAFAQSPDSEDLKLCSFDLPAKKSVSSAEGSSTEEIVTPVVTSAAPSISTSPSPSPPGAASFAFVDAIVGATAAGHAPTGTYEKEAKRRTRVQRVNDLCRYLPDSLVERINAVMRGLRAHTSSTVLYKGERFDTGADSTEVCNCAEACIAIILAGLLSGGGPRSWNAAVKEIRILTIDTLQFHTRIKPIIASTQASTSDKWKAILDAAYQQSDLCCGVCRMTLSTVLANADCQDKLKLLHYNPACSGELDRDSFEGGTWLLNDQAAERVMQIGGHAILYFLDSESRVAGTVVAFGVDDHMARFDPVSKRLPFESVHDPVVSSMGGMRPQMSNWFRRTTHWLNRHIRTSSKDVTICLAPPGEAYYICRDSYTVPGICQLRFISGLPQIEWEATLHQLNSPRSKTESNINAVYHGLNRLVLATNRNIEIYSLPSNITEPIPKFLKPIQVLPHAGSGWSHVLVDHGLIKGTHDLAGAPVFVIAYSQIAVRLYWVNINDARPRFQLVGEVEVSGYITALSVGASRRCLFWSEHEPRNDWRQTTSRVMMAPLPPLWTRPSSGSIWAPPVTQVCFDIAGGPISHCNRLHVDEELGFVYLSTSDTQSAFIRRLVFPLASGKSPFYLFDSGIVYGCSSVQPEDESAAPSAARRVIANALRRQYNRAGPPEQVIKVSTGNLLRSEACPLICLSSKESTLQQLSRTDWTKWSMDIGRLRFPNQSSSVGQLASLPKGFKKIPKWQQEGLEEVSSGLRSIVQVAFNISSDIRFLAVHSSGRQYLAVVPTEDFMVYLIVSHYSNAELKKDMYSLETHRVPRGQLEAAIPADKSEYAVNENMLDVMEAYADDERILMDPQGNREDRLAAASMVPFEPWLHAQSIVQGFRLEVNDPWPRHCMILGTRTGARLDGFTVQILVSRPRQDPGCPPGSSHVHAENTYEEW